MGRSKGTQSPHSKVWWLLLGAAFLALMVAGNAQVITETTGTVAETSQLLTTCADAPTNGCARGPKRQLFCAVAFDRKYTTGSYKARLLKLCAWPGPAFDPATELNRFQLLDTFSLADSNISLLESDFPPLRNLEIVELASLRLETLSASAFAQLAALRSVDLRGNLLRVVPAAALAAPPSLRTVLLADNPWDCKSRGMDWLAPDGGEFGTSTRTVRLMDGEAAIDAAIAATRIADASALVCRDDKFNRRPLLTVLQYRQAMEAGCPRVPVNCSCSLTVVPDLRAGSSGEDYIPVVTVDCSSRGLRELPPALPANATILHVEGNQISDLRPLVSNPAYANVVDLYLDGNTVASVAILEGSTWLASFRLLSLRTNRIRRLPAYALESALLRNRQAAHLYLGENPWMCDCQTTPSFQEFLVKFREVVQDQQDIRCSLDMDHGADSEDGRVRIRDVSRTVLCREHGGYLVQPLDLLNGALASLILLILGKLAYDYWHFKKTGKLPWIVTKMP